MHISAMVAVPAYRRATHLGEPGGTTLSGYLARPHGSQLAAQEVTAALDGEQIDLCQ